MLPDRLAFAIVDEVDSILIDESRNPMIISQPRGDNGQLVVTVDKVWVGDTFDSNSNGHGLGSIRLCILHLANCALSSAKSLMLWPMRKHKQGYPRPRFQAGDHSQSLS